MVHIPDDWQWYGYSVNEGAAIAGSVVFGGVGIQLYWKMVRSRAYYTWSIVLSAIFEMLGFILRRFSANHQVGGGKAMDLYISSTVFLVLAPAFTAGGVYVTFRRLVLVVGTEHSRLTRQIARCFVALDVASITLQATGLSLYGSSSVSGRATTIKALLIAGFVVQLGSFVSFFAICLDYHLRARKNGQSGDWEKLSIAICAIDALILVRSIYRCIEYSTTTFNSGTIREHEAFFYCLDSLPIFLSLVIFTIWHPAQYLELENHTLPRIEESPIRGSGSLSSKEAPISMNSPRAR